MFFKLRFRSCGLGCWKSAAVSGMPGGLISAWMCCSCNVRRAEGIWTGPPGGRGAAQLSCYTSAAIDLFCCAVMLWLFVGVYGIRYRPKAIKCYKLSKETLHKNTDSTIGPGV